jgi:hypothetical protein
MSRLCKKILMFASRPVASALVIGYADLVQLLKVLFDSYRPELHYMRGPGPKWHAKHG